jgi:hypothetical protein
MLVTFLMIPRLEFPLQSNWLSEMNTGNPFQDFTFSCHTYPIQLFGPKGLQVNENKIDLLITF